MSITNKGIGDEFRGRSTSWGNKDLCNKDFAIAYNKLICLVGGFYTIMIGTHQNTSLISSGYASIRVNGVDTCLLYHHDVDPAKGVHMDITLPLKRGDTVDWKGPKFADNNYRFNITKV